MTDWSPAPDDDRPTNLAASARQRLSEPDRLLAFTDGVFAIIITILVLEIAVPTNLGEQSLEASLRELRPTFIAWLISFLVTGMYWVWHRDVFSRVKAVNRDVIWLNLLFLVPVSLIPFAASVLGEYDTLAVALHLYGIVLVLATIMRTALFRYIAKRPALLFDPITSKARRLGTWLAAGPIVVYACAILIAEPLPRASLALYALGPLLYFGAVTLLRDRSATSVDADDYS